jgi:hypothetical protein
VTDLTELLRSAEPATEPGFDADDIALRVRARARRRARVTATTAVVVIGLIAVLGAGTLDVWRRPTPGVVLTQPTAPFVGTWESVDVDGSSQTMEIARSDGEYRVIYQDDVATTCSGAPATMTGNGLLVTDERLVIAQPELTCDDGTVPSIGPAPQAELADHTFELDTAADELVDSFGVVWRRAGSTSPPADAEAPDAAAPGTAPATTSGTSGGRTSGGMWPQSTLEEVRAAQELADAGDPDATWQLGPDPVRDEEPWGAEIFSRFIEEELGWEQSIPGASFSGLAYAEGGGSYEGVLFIRCAPGQTNPLSPMYAEAPGEVRGCAPTIDDLTYETVSFAATQPGRRGPTGIWVVERWEILQSPADPGSLFGLLHPDFLDGIQVTQVVPPSDAEVTALLEAFLGARLDGAGAEQHLLREPEGSPFEDTEVPVPLLYATTGGASYERFEIEHLRGPVWPTGWLEYEVRLFSEGGTVVEQRFHVVRRDTQLGLIHGEDSRTVTTEDGEPVAVPQRVLLDTVTVTAPPLVGYGRDFLLQAPVPRSDGRIMIVADPQLDCEEPAPADAAALARDIVANPDFAATEPVPVRLAGNDWLQLDLRFSDRGRASCLWADLPPGDPGWHARLHLIDYPDGSSSPYLNVLMIAIIAPEADVERVLAEAAPILASLELHPET